MGKVTGFMEYERESPRKAAIEERITHYKEFESALEDDAALRQGARCMDCGVPFCHGDTGCPVDNLIPEWNDLVFREYWQDALMNLHSTNNFPEFTGRLCPAPCEGACVLGINENPVAIKSLERAIIDKGFEEGWVEPRPPVFMSGKKVAVIGSGPAGLAAAQQLQRAGHAVTVFEKSDRPGGLLRYGIPDFKMEKWLIDRRIKQMEAEGVSFQTGVHIGVDRSAASIREEYDAMVLSCGSEEPRTLPVPGIELTNVHFAMDFLVPQNKVNAGDNPSHHINVKGKNVLIIGGGDTGSDCVGTSNRQGAHSVVQAELFPRPVDTRPQSTPWPLYPLILRTSSSHEEGVERRWCINTKGFLGDDRGELRSAYGCEVQMENGRMVDVPGTDFEWPVDYVFLAMGFVNPVRKGLLQELMDMGLVLDERKNVKATFREGSVGRASADGFATTVPGVYACGDVRRGQSLIVWAIAEGRNCAASVHQYLALAK